MSAPPGFGFREQDDNFVLPGEQGRVVEPNAALEKRVMQHRAWQMGKSPFQSVFSSLLMLYFSGSQLSLMSLMLCFFMLTGPIKGAKQMALSFLKLKRKARFSLFQVVVCAL
jgi:hypothetical protein